MAVDIPREIALKILYEVSDKKAYSNISLNKHLEKEEIREIDRAFITELVYGTLKWNLKIDYIIEQFSNISFKKISPWILNILRLGIYQIIYMDRVPQSAACNESVELAKKYGHSASSRYVNAVLRNLIRQKDSIKYPDKNQKPETFLSIKHSHPQWMVKMWLSDYGFDFTDALLNSNNQMADFTVRTNTLKISPEELLETLQADGLEAETGKYVDKAIIIKNPSSVTRIEAFKKGLFQVQDESSMLAAIVLDPKLGEVIIDVCSAPAGKASHIAQLMLNKGKVIARDIHPHKIKIINEVALRLGINIIETSLQDATLIDENYIGKGDRVLVDAPCTGLGIIRRKPDIKMSKNYKDIGNMSKLQHEILKTSSLYVKPGGVMVYSICTIVKEESIKIVENFLKQNQDFELEDFSHLLPENLDRQGYSKGYMQLYPNIHKIDGFFISKFRRKKTAEI